MMHLIVCYFNSSLTHGLKLKYRLSTVSRSNIGDIWSSCIFLVSSDCLTSNGLSVLTACSMLYVETLRFVEHAYCY